MTEFYMSPSTPRLAIESLSTKVMKRVTDEGHLWSPAPTGSTALTPVEQGLNSPCKQVLHPIIT